MKSFVLPFYDVKTNINYMHLKVYKANYRGYLREILNTQIYL